MTTVATKNAVLLHAPKTGGTTATLALAGKQLVEYDYRYHKIRPHEHGLTYDNHCHLCHDGKIIDHPANSNPHATASQLRLEDQEKQKILIIREPHEWYPSFWAHHRKFGWNFTSGMPTSLLRGGAHDNFHKWIQNILDSEPPGFCTKYFRLYGYQDALRVRLEYLVEDWRRLTDPLGLAEAADLMDVRHNADSSQSRTSLRVPQHFIDRLKTLDREIYEQY